MKVAIGLSFFLLYFCQLAYLVFPARPLPLVVVVVVPPTDNSKSSVSFSDSISKSSSSSSSPLSMTNTTNSLGIGNMNFSKLFLVDRGRLKKGSSVQGISHLKKYLSRFGYLNDSNSNFTNLFDLELESALFSYQKNHGLPLTGRLDSTTLSHLDTPRCGVPDHYHDYKSKSKSSTTINSSSSSISTAKRYAYFYGHPRWLRPPPMTLTYSFSPDHSTVDYLTTGEIRSSFRRAFSRWSAVIPVVFEETEDYAAADVKIGFYGGEHGDGEPFDGSLGVLGHGFSPESGRLHLDAAEMWAVDFERQRSKVAVDLESVATHEIGHVLGLAHSKMKDSIMYPSLSPRTKKVQLRIDDVEGVQALYGSNPNFNVTSFEEAETTTSSSSSSSHKQHSFPFPFPFPSPSFILLSFFLQILVTLVCVCVFASVVS